MYVCEMASVGSSKSDISVNSSSDWHRLETVPWIVNGILEKLDVFGLQAAELYGLDNEKLSTIKPIYGLLLLYKWHPGGMDMLDLLGKIAIRDNVMFMRQVILNACLTQALVNILINITDPEVGVGPIVSSFKKDTILFDSLSRGVYLGNNKELIEIHNNFATDVLAEKDLRAPEKHYWNHYVIFMPVGQTLYAFDGLKTDPLNLGQLNPGKDWLDIVRPIILDKIALFNDIEIGFNVYAIHSSKENQDRKFTQQKMQKESEADSTSPNEDELSYKKVKRERESEKKIESIIHRHNYTPFIVEFLKLLAKENKLDIEE